MQMVIVNLPLFQSLVRWLYRIDCWVDLFKLLIILQVLHHPAATIVGFSPLVLLVDFLVLQSLGVLLQVYVKLSIMFHYH